MNPLRFHHPEAVTRTNSSDDTFDPEAYFLGLLLKSTKAEVPPTLFSHPTLGEIIVLPEKQRYCTNVTQLDAWCQRPVQEFRLRLHSDAASLGDSKLLPLDELLWRAAFYASAGRLMNGCTKYDVVLLNHWPNLSRLPATPDFMRLSALLSRRPHSIDECCQLLEVSEADAYTFYCAAIASRALKLINRPAHAVAAKIEPEPPHVNQQSLTLRSLWRRLTGRH